MCVRKRRPRQRQASCKKWYVDGCVVCNAPCCCSVWCLSGLCLRRSSQWQRGGGGGSCVVLCECVRERERERESLGCYHSSCLLRFCSSLFCLATLVEGWPESSNCTRPWLGKSKSAALSPRRSLLLMSSLATSGNDFYLWHANVCAARVFRSTRTINPASRHDCTNGRGIILFLSPLQ